MKKNYINLIGIGIVLFVMVGSSLLAIMVAKETHNSYNRGFVEGKAIREESFNNIHHRYQEVLSSCDYMCNNCIEDNPDCVVDVCKSVNEEADFYNAW